MERKIYSYKKFYENFVRKFKVNNNQYWFEVRDPKDEKGYSVGWGVGDLKDDNISKFNRTDRFEQFKIFKEVKKYFMEWFRRNNPDTFYFSVPGEKRMRIYMNFIDKFLSNYSSEIIKTEYDPFDLKEDNVYYVVYRKNN